MVWGIFAFVALMIVFAVQIVRDIKLARELENRVINEVWFCGAGKPVKIYGP